jgi:hypothetical protein
MAPRITLDLAANGELEILLNEEGRDLLVRKLLALNQTSEHFHLGAYDGAEVKLRSQPYGKTDKIILAAKVLFRTDEWDLRYYPHVMSNGD